MNDYRLVTYRAKILASYTDLIKNLLSGMFLILFTLRMGGFAEIELWKIMTPFVLLTSSYLFSLITVGWGE